MKSRRKELLEQFKQMKPDMGIFWIRSKERKKCFLETSQNLKGKMNSTRFQLDAGNHPFQELQREWKESGAGQFQFEVLELLKYDKDESKTDYSDELAIMKMLWEEKLSEQGFEFYKKK
jgi:hypothetical protein